MKTAGGGQCRHQGRVLWNDSRDLNDDDNSANQLFRSHQSSDPRELNDDDNSANQLFRDRQSSDSRKLNNEDNAAH